MPQEKPLQGPSTRAVHGGERQQRLGDAVTVPIYQTSTYVFRNTQELVDFKEGRIEKGEYGRYGNPTINAAERKVAELEHAEDALLWASGMCAVTSLLLTILRAGQHMIITADSYRRTRQFCDGMLRRLGIEVTVVPPGGLGAIEDRHCPLHREVVPYGVEHEQGAAGILPQVPGAGPGRRPAAPELAVHQSDPNPHGVRRPVAALRDHRRSAMTLDEVPLFFSQAHLLPPLWPCIVETQSWRHVGPGRNRGEVSAA